MKLNTVVAASRNLLAAAIVFGTVGLASAAGAASDPMAMVKTTVDAVVNVLNDPGLKSQPPERIKKLRDLVINDFDFESMSRSAMGYHWRDLSGDQKKEFVGLFTAFMEDSYIGKIDSYTDQKVQYVKSSSDEPGYAQVDTNIVQEGKDPVAVSYRLKQDGDDWKVYDVTVEGISIIANYRNQFNRVINNQGFASLIDQMRAKKADLDAHLSGS